MKIIVVGGAGMIGKAIADELSQRHSIIVAGRKHGDVHVDISNPESIENMFQVIGKVDAVVSAAGDVHFGPLTELTMDQVNIGLASKLMGQVNLVLHGLKHINNAGSFTLTSGVLSHDPIRFGSCASMVNGALDSFVKSAAIELPGNIRINIVSPTVVTEAMDKYGSYFHGFESVPVKRVALAYSKSVEGAQTGQVYQVI